MLKVNQNVIWRESASRRIVAALSSSYTSISHAVYELVDNAVDAMGGQACVINIELDKPGNRIVVESIGGSGMGAAEIAVWLNWGEGAHHVTSDIGHYGQGGKSACGYLGDSLRLWSKLAGEADIWMFEDLNWRTRADFIDFGEESRSYDEAVEILELAKTAHLRFKSGGPDEKRQIVSAMLRTANSMVKMWWQTSICPSI